METAKDAAEAPFWVRYNRERQARERAAKRRLVETLRVERGSSESDYPARRRRRRPSRLTALRLV